MLPVNSWKSSASQEQRWFLSANDEEDGHDRDNISLCILMYDDNDHDFLQSMPKFYESQSMKPGFT
jgi:hypothetical protein